MSVKEMVDSKISTNLKLSNEVLCTFPCSAPYVSIVRDMLIKYSSIYSNCTIDVLEDIRIAISEATNLFLEESKLRKRENNNLEYKFGLLNNNKTLHTSLSMSSNSKLLIVPNFMFIWYVIKALVSKSSIEYDEKSKRVSVILLKNLSF